VCKKRRFCMVDWVR